MKECTTCLNVNVWSQRNNKSKKTYWVYFVSGWEDSFCFICFCVCQSSSCSVFKMNEIHVYFMQIYQVLIFLPLLGIESEAFYIPSETFTIEIYPQSQFLMLPKLYSERQLYKVLILWLPRMILEIVDSVVSRTNSFWELHQNTPEIWL